MTMQAAPVTSPNGNGPGPSPSGDTSPADRIADVASRVLEAIAARLADSVEAVADRMAGADGRPRSSDDDDGPGVRDRLGAGLGFIAARLAEILQWIMEQGARLVSAATGLLSRGRSTDEDEGDDVDGEGEIDADADADELADRRAVAP